MAKEYENIIEPPADYTVAVSATGEEVDELRRLLKDQQRQINIIKDILAKLTSAKGGKPDGE